MIDRERVRRSFGNGANGYDESAVVQKEVLGRFVELLRCERQSPGRLLDVGAGTGTLLAQLTRDYGGVQAVGVDLAPEMCAKARRRLHGLVSTSVLTADAERLPFDDASFDLVVSTSAFQWLETLDLAFAEASRVLAPGGLFFFALFGEGTLFELQTSYRRALADREVYLTTRLHRFFVPGEVEEAMERAGFDDCRFEVATHLEYHRDVAALLRSLKCIGAGCAAPRSRGGLSGRDLLRAMAENYQRDYGRDGMVPATYRVIYGMGKKRGIHGNQGGNEAGPQEENLKPVSLLTRTLTAHIKGQN